MSHLVANLPTVTTGIAVVTDWYVDRYFYEENVIMSTTAVEEV